MPITTRDLVVDFGRFARSGNASIFVGAGLSQEAGYPGWDALLNPLRSQAAIPDTVSDLPLVAQYFVQTVAGGKDALHAHILRTLAAIAVHPTPFHESLAEIPVDDFWTTNYDCLLEEARPDATVLATEESLEGRISEGRRRIIKMHGSLSQATPPTWLAPPTITREDYERYEQGHPRMWSLLRATYLTKSMLFLGFSFTDPNFDVLLRLSRLLDASREHFTVLRRPADPDLLRDYELRRNDLESSGVGVLEFDNYDELGPLLSQLARRTREPWIFVGGSHDDADNDAIELSRAIGTRLADHEISVASLAGKAALKVSYAFGHALSARDEYAAESVRFYFRPSPGAPPPPLDERIGTAVYTEKDNPELLSMLLRQCRAALFIGGGDQTDREITRAREMEIPIIPLASVDGSSKALFESGYSFPGGNDLDWLALSSDNPHICAAAVGRLVKQAMFLDADGGA